MTACKGSEASPGPYGCLRTLRRISGQGEKLRLAGMTHQAAQSGATCTRRLSRQSLRVVGRDATRQSVCRGRKAELLAAGGNPGRHTPKAVQRMTSGTNQQEPMPSMRSRMSCAAMIVTRTERPSSAHKRGNMGAESRVRGFPLRPLRVHQCWRPIPGLLKRITCVSCTSSRFISCTHSFPN